MDKFTIIQWNARGLNKSRLEEFRNFLSLSKPSVVLLSETFWNTFCKVKFRSYNIIQRNRHGRPGGGVAILIHSSINFTPLSVDTSASFEVVGATITSSSHGPIDVISVYCPKGDCSKEEFDSLIIRDNNFIVGGDFNGHHDLWESCPRSNKSGAAIYSSLLDNPDVTLLTPRDLPTYVNPGSGKPSTIDLTFTSPDVSLDSTVKLGPYLGSDHYPIVINLSLTPKDLQAGIPRWIFTDDKWLEWNNKIHDILRNVDFLRIRNADRLYELFYNALITASSKFHKKSTPTPKPEPTKP